jgi:radical SAM protein with 4Fe4S-binding SPASM domain
MGLRATFDRLRQQSKSPEVHLPPEGLHHFTYQQGGEHSRVHLRIDQDGSGLLLVNAARVVHLNPTAVLMAYLLLNQTKPNTALQILGRRFDVAAAQLKDDYAQFADQLNELVRPEGACPVHELELDILAPFSSIPSAPYRMDLALTYRCNNDCSHCYNARPRSFPEMDTGQWKQVISHLWEIGIPHLVFTGGEPTLRSDLCELISYAEHLGQITGLNTNGRRLSDPTFVKQLVDAGLDHVQITLESHDPYIHNQMVCNSSAWKQTVNGIQNALESPLFVMTNTTMLQSNRHAMKETLQFLAELGVPTIGLNALIYSGHGLNVGTGLQEAELTPLLEMAQQMTEANHQKLIWYTPTQYCHFDPMQMELGVKGCTAALYNMCIEPDGSVLPCQSYYQPLGNFLNDSWTSIWNHDLCNQLRQRRYVRVECQGCALLQECGGGCPLTPHSSQI